MCKATPTLLCNVFHNFHASKANEAPIYAQFIPQYTKSQNQLFQPQPLPISLAPTLEQFPWARTKFAFPFVPSRYRDAELVLVHVFKLKLFFLESKTCHEGRAS